MKNNKSAEVKSNIADIMNTTFDKTLELASANSVFGEPIIRDGVTIIPVSKISAGFAGGGADIADGGKKKAKSPAGAGAKVEVTPTHFLQISGGRATMVPVANANPPKPDTTDLLMKAITVIKKLKK
ncbi:MAG: sporulation protein YtfJ [Clostridia bacterium]|nr:sporulation protein YtfJ [Clostridia bacterium]